MPQKLQPAQKDIIQIFENPVATLNNIKLGLINYTFIEKSYLEVCPIFEVIIDINEYIFKGQGHSKKIAKNIAANEALKYIFSVLNAAPSKTLGNIFLMDYILILLYFYYIILIQSNAFTN